MRRPGRGRKWLHQYLFTEETIAGSNQYKLIWNEGLDWDFYSEAERKPNWWHFGDGGKVKSSHYVSGQPAFLKFSILIAHSPQIIQRQSPVPRSNKLELQWLWIGEYCFADFGLTASYWRQEIGDRLGLAKLKTREGGGGVSEDQKDKPVPTMWFFSNHIEPF